MSGNAAPRRITIQEAAVRNGVSIWTIRRRIADGTLNAWRMPNGRAIRLDADQVDQLLRPIPAGGGANV